MRGKLIAGVVALWALAGSGSVGAAACPNEAIRAEQGTTALPDCMAVEMVSPPKKFGQGALLPHAFAPDEETALFYSTAGLAGTPGLQSPFPGDRYIGTRGAAGWGTTATSAPTGSQILSGGELSGGPFAYSADFRRWALLGGTQAESGLGIFQVFSDGVEAPFAPLSPRLIPLDDSGSSNVAFSVSSTLTMGVSDDLSTAVFAPFVSSIAYFPEDPRGLIGNEPGEDSNTYVATLEDGQPSLRLLTRDAADTGKAYGGRCGSRLGGGRGSVANAPSGRLNQGAIAPDGSRIFLTTRPGQPESVGTFGPPCDTANPLRIMTWQKTLAGPSVEQLFEGGPPEGDDLFQGASADGGRVFFVTPRSLAPTDTDTPAPGAACGRAIGSSAACDLYLYDSSLPEGERLIQASAGGTGDPDPGKGADVLSSITALSTDGTHAYFVAQGVLTTVPNPAGAVAQPNQPNLYLYERNAENPDGRTAFVGTLAASDLGVLWGSEQSLVGGAYAVPMVGATPEHGADGHILLLASKASLTGEDPDGTFRDVFRYDAEAEALQILSNPSEEVLPFDVEVNSNERSPMGAPFSTEGRWASEDGLTVAFSTAEQLVPGDADGAADPYLWKEGQLSRLPGNHLRPIVSASGDQFGFTTADALLPQDGDTAPDAYVVRANGGFPPPPPPEPEPVPPPAVVPPALGPAFVGPGNPKVKATPKCRKNQVRRKGRCVKKANAGKHGKAGQGRKGGRR